MEHIYLAQDGNQWQIIIKMALNLRLK